MTGYNGAYLENLVQEGHTKMVKSIVKRGSKVQRELMDQVKLDYYFEQEVKEAIAKVKSIDYKHWKGAKRHADGDTKSLLDHYCAIDDVIEDKKNDLFIGIDWTTNRADLIHKIEKHKKFSSVYKILGIDYVVVAYVINEDAIPSNKEGKFVYKALIQICNEVVKVGFSGGVLLDARELIK